MCLFCSKIFTILKLFLHTLNIKIPLKLQHVSDLTGPSSGSTSSLAKVTTVFYFSRYTYIGVVEASFHMCLFCSKIFTIPNLFYIH